MSEHDDLERRLRAAFDAKAEQITDADLDLDREDEVARQLRAPSHPRRRVYAGAGIAAAAAAIIGVGALAIQPGAGHAPVDAASHRSTTSVSVGTGANATGTEHLQATPLTGRSQGPAIAASSTGPARSPAATVHATPNGTQPRTPLSGPITPAPPVMPTGLPQAGQLGTGKYAGPVPITDASGGPVRMLGMPDGTRWQVLSRTGRSLTVRITDLPTDIEAYWARTLPGLGWVAAHGGWQMPGTPYAVSAISDKAAFTVSW